MVTKKVADPVAPVRDDAKGRSFAHSPINVSPVVPRGLTDCYDDLYNALTQIKGIAFCIRHRAWGYDPSLGAAAWAAEELLEATMDRLEDDSRLFGYGSLEAA